MACVDVVLLPEHLRGRQIISDTLIVVDVLRASTTIISALDAGASAIAPMRSVEDARAYAKENPEAVLCGERGGVPPKGFTLGNSPLEYANEVVGGRELVLTTTNGTRALSMVSESSRVLIGAITNRLAVCEEAAKGGDGVTIVCAGTDGDVSLDDCIAAGMMVQRLMDCGFQPSECAVLVAKATKKLILEGRTVESSLRSTKHGQRLVSLDMSGDIEFASRTDSSLVVPRYEPKSNRIVGC